MTLRRHPPDAAAATSVPSRLPYRVLITLSLCVFALCSSEYVLVGVLVDIASQLGVSLSQAGGLLTSYALTAAVAGPVIALLTARMPLKRLILILMVLFAAANVAIGLTDDYVLLLVARSVAALSHSTFAAACIIVGVRLTPTERIGTAISWVTAGFSAATVLGGPLGAFIGSLGGWHASFLAVAAANVLGVVAMLAIVPDVARNEPADIRGQLRRIANRRVLAGLLVTAVAQAAWFAPYGYVVAMLTDSAGLSRTSATAMLLIFGCGNVIGNLIGGRLTDRSPQRSLIGLLTVLAVSLLLVSVFVRHGIVLCVVVATIGLVSGALIPILNTWVLGAAGGNSVLSLTLVTSAFNLGNGIGAALAGWVVAEGFINGLGSAGALIAATALLTTLTIRTVDGDFMRSHDSTQG